eukprot:SAG31_NODE_4444_length_3225_cov_2.086052_5_plen_44_part_00
MLHYAGVFESYHWIEFGGVSIGVGDDGRQQTSGFAAPRASVRA